MTLLSVSGNNASRVFYLHGGFGVSLGADHHRRALAFRRRPGQLRRQCHADRLHRQRQLRLPSGGGLFNYGGTVTLTDCTVSGNSASDGGGGLDNLDGTATLIYCTVSGNSAAQRRRPVTTLRHGDADQLHRQRQLGATAAACTQHGTATLTNCTVSGNSAARQRRRQGGLVN